MLITLDESMIGWFSKTNNVGGLSKLRKPVSLGVILRNGVERASAIMVC